MLAIFAQTLTLKLSARLDFSSEVQRGNVVVTSLSLKQISVFYLGAVSKNLEKKSYQITIATERSRLSSLNICAREEDESNHQMRTPKNWLVT